MWPQFRQPSGLGRFCRVHLRYGISPFLVVGMVPDLAISAIARRIARRNHLWRAGDGLARLRRHGSRYETASILLAGLGYAPGRIVHNGRKF